MSFRLGVVRTGGTIGCNWADGDVAVLSNDDTIGLADLVRWWPGSEPPAVLTRTPLNLASEDLQPPDWLPMADAVRQLAAEGADAVIVLHGTDTATYTCAALSFLLPDQSIPVLVTGAGLPPDHPDSDAGANLTTAMSAARHGVPGVFLAFFSPEVGAGEIHLGTRVRKTGDPARLFRTVGGPPIARTNPMRGYESLAVPPQALDLEVLAAIDPAVLSVRCHPGLDFLALRTMVVAAGARGVVLELYASGTGPTRPGRSSLPEFARWCEINRIAVVSTLWNADGRVPPRYESTLALADAGILFLPAALPEVATVKLMWALAQPDHDPLELMRTPISGEW
jgi:glutamyl-tRNA(Gln) amidotransferase subunit D